MERVTRRVGEGALWSSGLQQILPARIRGKGTGGKVERGFVDLDDVTTRAATLFPQTICMARLASENSVSSYLAGL